MTLLYSKYSVSIMARLITSVRENSPTTTNLENSEIESISLAVNLIVEVGVCKVGCSIMTVALCYVRARR